jgi:hypothetical protein
VSIAAERGCGGVQLGLTLTASPPSTLTTAGLTSHMDRWTGPLRMESDLGHAPLWAGQISSGPGFLQGNEPTTVSATSLFSVFSF